MFFLVVLLVAAGGAWLFRDALARWIDRTLHPEAAAARIGHPSSDHYTAAMAKLRELDAGADSVVLTANEMATMVKRGISFLAGVTSDSFTLELGDRSVRIRTIVDSARIPGRFRELIPGKPAAFEEIVARGAITPVRTGLAEITVQHVTVHGVPLPSDLVGRLATQLSGRGSEGRVEVTLPPQMSGFRVRPGGVAVYRPGAAR